MAKATTKSADAVAEVKETKAVKEEVKVYHFTSINPFLTCAHLGVQFINGKAKTTHLEVARQLVKIAGVELVED
jgi:hypothetical protein